ncbi:hypothetical protein FRC00_012168 [Tulasnella sp. 408]|nr:hypothetical protein FRC00_012168 [Tulasnella sp. 408]
MSFMTGARDSDQGSRDITTSALLVSGRTFERHERHWYEEGNFVFLVGNTAFRLHRSILSMRSPVIADLLRIPHPLLPITEKTNPEENMIGVQSVELNDHAEDFAHVLDFIYPTSLPGTQTGHHKVEELMGVIRVTGKYLIEDLKEWAISALGAAHLLPSAKSSPKALLENKSLYADPNFCVKIVQFSRECSLPRFLPLAFYSLATAEWDLVPGGASCLDQLSPQDRTRVHEGRLALSKAVLEKGILHPGEL